MKKFIHVKPSMSLFSANDVKFYQVVFDLREGLPIRCFHSGFIFADEQSALEYAANRVVDTDNDYIGFSIDCLIYCPK